MEASRLVDVLLVTLVNLTSTETWAHLASAHLVHASRALDSLYIRLSVQLRRSKQRRNSYRQRPKHQHIQYLEHAAPQLEPACRLRTPFSSSASVKLMLQLEETVVRLVASAKLLARYFWIRGFYLTICFQHS